jgi:hypothetical protein
MARALLLSVLAVLPLLAEAQDAAALRARHAALRDQLAASPFGRPLHVESKASGGEHEGEVYAVVAHPYDAVAPALSRPDHWCDILLLQVNVKRCEVEGQAVAASITRKPRESLDDAYRVEFRFHLPAATHDYLQVALTAPRGPVGTSDYRIGLQAVPLGESRTFLHMSYAYTLGFMARIAMDAYLAGSGSEKVGFSVVSRTADGQPVYAGGVRGVIERSAMRHYLAIEAFLDSPQDLEPRLRGWYAAISRHPQLREDVGRDEYLAMKRLTFPESRRRSRAASAPS